MADGIYEEVISTGSAGSDRERVEMMVDIYESADAVRDQDFRTETNTQPTLQNTGRDCVKMRITRAAPVCLVLLCFLVTAVVMQSVYIYTKNTNYTQERNQQLTRITNITEERVELLTRNTNLREEKKQLLDNITSLKKEKDQMLTSITSLTKANDQMLTNITSLTKERDKLLTNNNNLIQTNAKLYQEKDKLLDCFNGKGVCKFHQSIYFISSEKKSWTDSRRDCQQRGADLIIINNREENDFVQKISRDSFWIGLTDSDEEGKWKWVDGSNMTSGFWISGEPSGGRGENCASSQTSWWYDNSCDNKNKWICENIFFF